MATKKAVSSVGKGEDKGNLMDIVTKKKRSEIMGKIRCVSMVEIRFRKLLWEKGLRYRINYKLYGRPDICFPKQMVAVFVDGDFWHGRNYPALLPKTNKKFWRGKIERTIERDTEVNAYLTIRGWKVIRIFESDINREPGRCIGIVLDGLREAVVV